MNPTMQAVVIHGREDYRLEQVPVPVPGAGEALVKVHAVGICASDLKCHHGAPMYWGDGPVPPNVDLLAIPGHEFVGEQAGITVNPDPNYQPTWQEVSDWADKLRADDRAGICLRGKPGWGELLAPLDTVINTFGGRWFDENWNAQLNSPEVSLSYPLQGVVLTFYDDALPPWLRDQMAKDLGPMAGLMDSRER